MAFIPRPKTVSDARIAPERERRSPAPDADSKDAGRDFVRQIVAEHVRTGRYGGRVLTRFPPEPNGYLHIGHAKSICLNFGVAEEFGGSCNLRYDDTNPETEDMAFVLAIQEDVSWLGFEWAGLFFASDYFERLYGFAEHLIRSGKAYVDSLSEDEIRELRGSVTEPGQPSPYRNRPVDESLDLFRRMRAGEFEDGAHVLRARIDMASPNMLMRDPLLYRIRHATHYRTGDDWCIYPLYDFTHCLSDAIEGITHSLCTLEFENNRELYDWVLDAADFTEPRPHQYEFNRLNLDYTVMSKRKLMRLVRDGHVEGWDDARMPTLAGLRRRGVTPRAIRSFCDMIGVAKTESRVELSKLDYAIRDDLNRRAPRVMGVLDPLEVVVATFPEDETDWIEAPHYPRDIGKEGSREVPFTRTLYIERSDFSEDPPRGWRRLAPGWEVRLRYGYIVRCEQVVRDGEGRVTELRCTHDPESRGGNAPDGRKIKGTIHWVSASRALPMEARLYQPLFTVPDPDREDEDAEPEDYLNPSSRVVHRGWIEPSVADDPPDTRYQLERLGYFWRDPRDSTPDNLVFNRIVSLRDSWSAKHAPPAPAAGHQPSSETEAADDADASAADGTVAGGSSTPRPLEGDELDRFERLTATWVVPEGDARTIAARPELHALLRDAVQEGASPPAASTWLVNDLLREMREAGLDEVRLDGRALARLLDRIDEGTLSVTLARDVFAELVRSGGDPDRIIEDRGLRQISSDDALRPIVERVLSGHPDEVRRYREGKTALLGFFVGRVMRETRGAANAERVSQLLREKLEG